MTENLRRQELEFIHSHEEEPERRNLTEVDEEDNEFYVDKPGKDDLHQTLFDEDISRRNW